MISPLWSPRIQYAKTSDGVSSAFWTLSDPSIHDDCLELLHLGAHPQNGKLDLGTWQRLFLVELFEPRRRTVDVAVLGE